MCEIRFSRCSAYAGDFGSVTAGDGSLRLELPVDGRAEGLARLAWELPVNEWAPLVHRLTGSEDPQVFEAASRGRAELPLDRPGSLELTALFDRARIVARGRETRLEPALELVVKDGEARIPPVALRSSGETFTFEARADLDRDWTAGESAVDLLTTFSVRGDGAFDAAPQRT